MLRMDTLTSSEFRKVYAKLTAPTVVTVNGHAIGEWRPVPTGFVELPAGTTPAEVEQVRDRFNSRPFTPVPKRGK
jgi:hypothetical protein